MATFECNGCNVSRTWEERNADYGVCNECAAADDADAYIKKFLYEVLGERRGNPNELLAQYKHLQSLSPAVTRDELITMFLST
jgi:hypothetical protein